MSDRCSACGHLKEGEFCSDCNREFACGSMSEECDRAGCSEKLIARKYVPAGDDFRVDHYREHHPERFVAPRKS